MVLKPCKQRAYGKRISERLDEVRHFEKLLALKMPPKIMHLQNHPNGISSSSSSYSNSSTSSRSNQVLGEPKRINILVTSLLSAPTSGIWAPGSPRADPPPISPPSCWAGWHLGSGVGGGWVGAALGARSGSPAALLPFLLFGCRLFPPRLLIISIFRVFQTNKRHDQAVGSSRRLQALPLGLN